ncbi:uncharacterized protein LOC143465005 [Clavelina lepadiformis]|uniref:uncharacterized protein LOC143465005 n=1 Tax=Clavelina lepadiformis TaxID=159417 RepID=UPI004042408B
MVATALAFLAGEETGKDVTRTTVIKTNALRTANAFRNTTAMDTLVVASMDITIINVISMLDVTEGRIAIITSTTTIDVKQLKRHSLQKLQQRPGLFNIPIRIRLFNVL